MNSSNTNKGSNFTSIGYLPTYFKILKRRLIALAKLRFLEQFLFILIFDADA
jgi:hypothetical protein